MPRFRIDNIGGLARQMAQFTPHDTRTAQIAAAEDLLHSIDPAKAYPLEFIIFKITGYHPRSPQGDRPALLTGLALQHDLGLLIERVSDTLKLCTCAMTEPVLMIEDVCDRFNVTSKTIQRWRRKGLPARRFQFPDGKRRVGFFLSSVERFLGVRREQVERGSGFSQVSEAEREQILAQARRLAVTCRCCTGDIIRRIARRTGRSPLTILHTIRKHDQDHPESAIFVRVSERIEEDERSRIVRSYRRGLSLKSIARRSCRPYATIYRLIVEERAARLTKRKVKFFDDPLYHGDDVELALSAMESQEPLLKANESSPGERLPRDIPPYVVSLCSAPLLTLPRERALFLKLNYRKFLFVQARRKIDPQLAAMRDLNRLDGLWQGVIETRNEIVRSNLRLVVSVARKHVRTGVAIGELVSDGTITLMRAVDGFDVHRGHRFSTYATLALMKGFARSVPQMLSAARRSGGAADELLASVPDRHHSAMPDRLLQHDELHELLARLDTRERSVLSAHYGLEAGAPATYEQLGERFGLSKERIRQIEQRALRKLRSAADVQSPAI